MRAIHPHLEHTCICSDQEIGAWYWRDGDEVGRSGRREWKDVEEVWKRRGRRGGEEEELRRE